MSKLCFDPKEYKDCNEKCPFFMFKGQHVTTDEGVIELDMDFCLRYESFVSVRNDNYG